jgi:hypothetical protein
VVRWCSGAVVQWVEGVLRHMRTDPHPGKTPHRQCGEKMGSRNLQCGMPPQRTHLDAATDHDLPVMEKEYRMISSGTGAWGCPSPTKAPFAPSIASSVRSFMRPHARVTTKN